MRVHWAHKWLSIPYQGRTITLHGQSAVIPECTIVELLLVSSSSTAQPELHPQIQLLLQQYVSVFVDPVGLPPSWDYEHVIPLIQGAQPMSVKAYRYPPQLKYEIE
jgi:starvation-inducible outer membrane lipoprotein